MTSEKSSFIPDTPHRIYRALGFMSGTSTDGVDAAIIETDGRFHIRMIAHTYVPYTPAMRQDIQACFGLMRDTHDGRIKSASRKLTDVHITAGLDVLTKSGFQADEIDIIGFHGQTITHAPDQKFTLQIGDPLHLSRSLANIPVVFDFRLADVAAGGQGAPLLPIYHHACTQMQRARLPIAIVNIGGVSNITLISKKEDALLAFDTGPGNALIDDAMMIRFSVPQDTDGKVAGRGRSHLGLVEGWIDQFPYFKQKPPKSLDRDAFKSISVDGFTSEDAIATLTLFTARSIAESLRLLPEQPHQLVITGGGRHNKTLMHDLEQVTGIPVHSIDNWGLNGDSLEAEGFAYMAVRCLENLPISFPGTTGVPRPMTGGRVYTSSRSAER